MEIAKCKLQNANLKIAFCNLHFAIPLARSLIVSSASLDRPQGFNAALADRHAIAVQIHGGIGMTDELNVGHYFKRLTLIDTLFGNTDHHLKRYAALS